MRVGAAAVTIALLSLTGGASSQAMSPMRGEVVSFSDQFAVRVFPSNPYDRRLEVEVKVYDQQFRQVPARVSPPRFSLGPNGSRSVLVFVPFAGEDTRKVRICTESVPFTESQTMIRTQICGKFLGLRRS